MDTSVWVEHLRDTEPQLAALLSRREVVMHPFVVGEIACGSLSDRPSMIELLQDLPMAVVAEDREVLRYIEQHELHGRGVGYVDVHLLVATVLTDGAKLWTRDKRLLAAAGQVGCAYLPADVH